MIISKTPLRMSFVGGGTDLKQFYEMGKGAVVSTAIQKYVYVTVNKRFDDSVRLSYSKTETVSDFSKIEHPIVKACAKLLELESGVEITSIADVPSKGTGLGSSSAFTLGLLNSLSAFQGKMRSAKWLAEGACHVEIDTLREPIGKQDQYACAFGGLNLIEFHEDHQVSVRRLHLSAEKLQELQSSCHIYFTGMTRSASAILQEQSIRTGSNFEVRESLAKMADLALEMACEIEKGRINTFGSLLNENWQLKRKLSNGISSPQIDEWYEIAMRCGAEGGKLLGAGAGGFLLFYGKPAIRQKLDDALKLRRVEFLFEKQGSSIIFVE